MSKKHMARSVIEGGRTRSNQFERHQSHRSERASAREWLARAAADADDFTEAVAPPEIDPVRKSFADKLGVPRRWLRSKVGEPWDEVYGEIKARFDSRSLAGRHILYDHMLPSIARADQPALRWWRHHDFIVGEDGILREGERRARHAAWHSARYLPPGKLRRRQCELDAWAAQRKLGARDDVWFWFVRTSWRWQRCSDHQCTDPAHHRWSVGVTKHVVPSFRQHHRLDEDALAFWNSVPEDQQKPLLYLVFE